MSESTKKHYARIDQLEDRIKGYEKANIDQGKLITNLRKENAILKTHWDGVQLLKAEKVIEELREELNMGNATYAWCEGDYKKLKSELLELLEEATRLLTRNILAEYRHKWLADSQAMIKKLKGENK